MLAGSVYLFIKEELKNHSGNYLEIGIWDGSGIAYISDHYPNKMLYAIDPFIDDGYTTHVSGVEKGGELSYIKEAAIRNIQDKKNIKLFNIKSDDFKEESDLNISLVFVDGDHSKKACTNDGKLAMSLIGSKSGGIIFDDIQVSEVGEAVSLFEKKYAERIVAKTTVRDATTVYFKIKEK